MKGWNMVRILFLFSAVSAYSGSNYDNMIHGIEGLRSIAPAIEAGYARKRQEKLDSVNRINDSLEIEIKKFELEKKKMDLERARRRAWTDSANFSDSINRFK